MSFNEKEVEELAKAYALLNAVEHGGKAVVGPVMGKIMAERPNLRSHAREVASIVRRIVDEVNKLGYDEQKRLLEEKYSWILDRRKKPRQEEKRLPPLPEAVEGRVVTRFAPNPDFVIHLGNARPAILSYEYKVMYKGKMILRFEDTDPRTKTPLPEAYELIRQDLKWLGVKWDEEYIQSLRLEIYYNIAHELLAKGAAYIDNESPEEFRRHRNEGILENYPPRRRSPEDNLELWDKMLEGYFGEGEAVLRIKTDPNHPDPSIRDWVAFRIIDTSLHPHPITGDKYIVWPTYNFAAAIDDHLMGVTHILRAREHMQNTIKQKYLYSHMGWEYPHVIHFGRLKLEGFIMSKSALKKLLEEGTGQGLSDPRFATIAGLRRRGIVSEAIRQLMIEVGVKYTDASISYVNLAAINRSIIDSKAKRIMAVFEPVKLIIKNIPWGSRIVEIPYHPSGSLGSRKIVLSGPSLELLVSRGDVELMLRNSVIRLMEAFNIIIKEVKHDAIIAYYHSESLEEARKYGAPIIQWVKPENSVKVELVVPEGLDLQRIYGVAEEAARHLRVDELVQFVRVGFARIDTVQAEGDSVKKITAVYAHD